MLNDIFEYLDIIVPGYIRQELVDETTNVLAYHHTIGRLIRNKFGLWDDTRKLVNDILLYKDKCDFELFEYNEGPNGNGHPDNISFLVIQLYQKYLRGDLYANNL